MKNARFCSPVAILYFLHFEEPFCDELVPDIVDLVEVGRDCILDSASFFDDAQVQGLRNREIECVAKSSFIIIISPRLVNSYLCVDNHFEFLALTLLGIKFGQGSKVVFNGDAVGVKLQALEEFLKREVVGKLARLPVQRDLHQTPEGFGRSVYLISSWPSAPPTPYLSSYP